MKRVYVIVEGQTEEAFVKGPLAETMSETNVLLYPIILGVAGHKGGRTSYSRLRKDLLKQLKQDRTAYCSTMIDFYGLGTGFPGTPIPDHLSHIEKVEHIERAVKQDICACIPDVRPDHRLIPHITLHEFEALLFSDPDAFAQALRQPNLAPRFHEVRNSFETPEHINDDPVNDDPVNAPSKRVMSIYSTYKKVIEGTLAARAVGIEKMRKECQHFRRWLEQLQMV